MDFQISGICLGLLRIENNEFCSFPRVLGLGRIAKISLILIVKALDSLTE